MGRLVHTGLGSSTLVAHVLISLSPSPPANSFVICTAVINTHTPPLSQYPIRFYIETLETAGRAPQFRVDANRLYMRATSAGEDNHDVLQQAVDLRLKEWHGWMNSSDRASRLGAAQAAQALAVYFVSMHRYDDARMWLENALSQCSGDLLFEYRYWYINAMNSSLRELVLQQLLELKTTTGGAAARDDFDVQSREGAPQAI